MLTAKLQTELGIEMKPESERLLSKHFSPLPVDHSLNGPPVELHNIRADACLFRIAVGQGRLIRDDQARQTTVALVQEVLRRL